MQRLLFRLSHPMNMRSLDYIPAVDCQTPSSASFRGMLHVIHLPRPVVIPGRRLQRIVLQTLHARARYTTGVRGQRLVHHSKHHCQRLVVVPSPLPRKGSR